MSVTRVYPAEMAEPIVSRFGGTLAGTQGTTAFYGGPDPPSGALLKGAAHCTFNDFVTSDLFTAYHELK